MRKGIRERRTFDVELRAEGDGEGRKIVGYAAKFDRESNDLGGFTEVIRRGAFAKTIQEADVRALFNHDKNYVLGRTKSGTLRLMEDEIGLRIEVDPPDAQWAQDLMRSIDRGDVDQMSFAFRAVQDRFTNRDAGPVLRELLEVRLFDVSPVTYPAYEDTEVSLRELVEGRELSEDEETALRHVLGEPEAEEPPPAGHSADYRARTLALMGA